MTPPSDGDPLFPILLALGDSALATDTEGVILEVNAAFETMTGYRRAELLGRKPSILKSGLTPLELYRDMWRTLTSGRAWRGVIQNRRKDGTIFESEETISCWRSPQGDIGGFVAVMRDLGERRALERAARQAAAAAESSENLLRSVFDAAPLGVWVIDARGRTLYSNPEMRRIIGDAPARGDEPPLRGVWSDAGLEMTPAEWPLSRALRLRQAQPPRTLLARGSDGEERCLLLSAFPVFGADGSLAKVFSFCQDVSEIQETRRALTAAEVRLQRTQRLETVGRLAAGIAHDFNNALAIISAYSESARTALPTCLPARSDIDEVLGAVARAKSLVAQLLAFGRQQALEPRAIDVAALIESMGNLLRGFLGASVRVETRVDCGAERRLFADACQLENALINLAVNARDAMPNGGTLTLAASDVSPLPIGTGPDGAHVEISVSDTGSGISPDLLPRIFEPFVTTKAPGKGTGLGLATAFGFARQSGGDLIAANRPEGGARLSLLLPRTDAPAPTSRAPETPTAPVSRGRERILLVDDDLALGKIIRQMLASSGYEVELFSDPVLASSQTPEELSRVALLLTDWQMAGMSGLALARHLRRAAPEMAVLYMSGNLEEFLEEEPRGNRLSKPFSRQELLLAVRAAIDGPKQPQR